MLGNHPGHCPRAVFTVRAPRSALLENLNRRKFEGLATVSGTAFRAMGSSSLPSGKLQVQFPSFIVHMPRGLLVVPVPTGLRDR